MISATTIGNTPPWILILPLAIASVGLYLLITWYFQAFREAPQT